MRINMLYWRTSKDGFVHSHELPNIPDGETLLSLLPARTSKQNEAWRTLTVAVNREHDGPATVLYESDGALPAAAEFSPDANAAAGESFS
jgi:hypothetical protein